MLLLQVHLVACLHDVMELLLLPREVVLMRNKLLVKRMLVRVDSQEAPDCFDIQQPTVVSSGGDNPVVRELTLGLPVQRGPVVSRSVRLARAIGCAP